VTEAFDKLLILQDHDRRSLQLTRESRDIPERKNNIKARLQHHRDAVRTAEEDLKNGQLKLKELEGDVEAFSTRLRKYKEQQMSVKNNDEYRALDREIASTRRDIGKFEERELVLMEQLEPLQAAVRDRKAELAEQEKVVAEELAALDERLVRIDAEIEALQRRRPELTAAVDAQWLSRYERILNNKGDVAIVPIENGACGGCHMKLPPQVVHDARKGSRLVSCSFCGRIVYFDG
jgi:uncharacterized protein